jgi:hypothetical protein
MKMNSVILLIMYLLFNQGCGDKEDSCHKTIIFVNNTEKIIYVESAYEYPDTLAYRFNPNPILDPTHSEVLPNEENTQVLWSRDCIELAFKDLIPSDTLMVFIFDGQVLENTPWDTIISNYLVLKRYDLSLQDLEQMNWTVEYP